MFPRAGVRYGAMAVESCGAGPDGPLPLRAAHRSAKMEWNEIEARRLVGPFKTVGRVLAGRGVCSAKSITSL
jgi:hypothetical protein